MSCAGMAEPGKPEPGHRPLSVLKSSSFRIIASFAGCLVVCGLAGVIWSGTRGISQLDRQMRETVMNERNEALADARHQDVPHLVPVMRDFVQSEPGFYYLLQDAKQVVAVGNMFHLRPHPGWRMLSWTHRTSPPDRRPVLGYGTLLDDGGYLFVGMEGTPLQTLRHGFFMTLLWCGTGFLVIGVAGGFAMSRLLLRRIDLISHTAREIMQGDLSRRLPLTEMDDEFNHLSASLNAMLDRNEALVARVRQVTDDIAHDMRRPLAHLGRHLDVAQAAVTVPEAGAALDLARASLDEALEIFASLLKLAQLEAYRQIPDGQLVDLAQVLHMLAALYGPTIEQNGQIWRHSPADQPMVVHGNRVLLTQMVSNLLENAMLHAPVGSCITLSAAPEGDEAVILVSDTGPGIAPEDRERVFEKMLRLDASRHVPGNGIGLSLVRAVAQLHGGAITLEDNGPGLRCVVRLPLQPTS
ncbi:MULTISPECIES: sensor histidine kinase [Asaia]|uniref:sensor histidine kinase n=1 Tax=Asaia TaxID=91914 RepID=UPI002FC2E5BB